MKKVSLEQELKGNAYPGRGIVIGSQSLSASDKGYEHEDSPEHAECGQQASCFISCDGNEDFLTGVHVYFHNLNLL